MSDPEPVDEAIASQEDTLEDYPLQPRFRPATPVRPGAPGPDAAPETTNPPRRPPSGRRPRAATSTPRLQPSPLPG